MDKRSEGRNREEEAQDLNSSLTLNQKGFAHGCSNDELIVYGDHDNEQDESSLLNSNLLKLLEEERTSFKANEIENSQKSPIGKKVMDDNLNFFASKSDSKPEPIRVFRTQRENATLKEIGPFTKDHNLVQDFGIYPKTTSELTTSKVKSKLSRQASKESLTNQKSGRSIRSRKQSKDANMLNNPPLKKTLASVMGSMSRPNLDKAPPQSLMSNPLESSPIFTNKTVKELKLAEKCSPNMMRSGLMMGSQPKSFLTSSPQVAHFHLPLERVDTDRTHETSKRIAHIMEILKTPASGSKDQGEAGFDSMGDADVLTRDTPSSKRGGQQPRGDVLGSEDASFTTNRVAGSLLASLVEGASPAKHTPRLDGYRPFTLSSVLAKKTRDHEN